MMIRAKFALGLAGILVVNLVAAFYALHLVQQAADREARVRDESSRIVSTALSAQVLFKKQVQEWKNVLLRGREPGLFEQYFTQFEQEETRAREQVNQLIGLLGDSGDSADTAREFLSAHIRLGDQYREALRHYHPQDPDPQGQVDLRVRGIDRAPTDLIDAVVAAALAKKEEALARIERSTRRVERNILLLTATVMIGAALLLIWLVDRSIGRPIATATAIARRVSAGDFSSPIRVKGSDENAQMLGALKTMQENLARSQECLRRSEAHSRLLLESSGEGIYGVATDGCCIFCNPAAARMLGYSSPAELEGRDMHQTMHYARADGTPYPVESCPAVRTHRDGQPVHVDDEVFWRADGTSFPVEYRSNPIYRDGQLVGAVVSFADISARTRAEAELRQAHRALTEERSNLAERVRERTAELARANAELARTGRAKDEFLAATSHELRTPLTSILGLSETMEDGLLGPLTPQQAKAARTIQENGTHLLELINDILDMTRVASGAMTLRWDDVPVNQLWDACLRLIAPSAAAKGLEIATDLDPAVRLVRGDGRRLKQMLINLLANAVKFTPRGGTIGLEVSGDVARGQARICVWDTGVGIAPEQRDGLFKPFVQIDSRLSREYGGTGLGLALASGMAKLHAGTIEVESEVGAGSRFTLILPWNPRIQDAAQVEPEAEIRGGQDLTPPTGRRPVVLLVEDNLGNLQMLSDYLRIRGCVVHTARDGVEAIAEARERFPDVILMDVQMPRMDGLEATRRLRADPVLRATPIIALTALAMPGDRQRCLDAGMDDYLSKPVGLKELHGVLIGWIRRRRPG